MTYNPLTSKAPLWAQVVVALAITLLLNGLIFGLGWNISTRRLPHAPPDWVIASVWMFLFAIMAVARWKAGSAADSAKGAMARRWILYLMAACWAYPFYTLALGSERNGLIGNVLTLIVAIIVALRIYPVSKISALLIIPVILWLSYATSLTAW